MQEENNDTRRIPSLEETQPYIPTPDAEEAPQEDWDETEAELDEAPDAEEELDAPKKTVGKGILYVAGVLAAAFLLSYLAWICASDVLALSKPDREVEITVSETDDVASVTKKLSENQLIDYPWLFRLYCSLTHASQKISPGTYKLNNVYDYHALVNGLRATSETRETVTVMIPEGYTCKQIFDLLAQKGVCTVEELETAASSYMFDYDFLQDLPYGETNRLEGYLFPDTYIFYVGDTPERVLSKFLDNFSWKFDEELQADIESLNETLQKKMLENGFTSQEIADNQMDLHKVVVIASMIERETGGISESSTIASVIYNRLTSKIYPLLQVDAALRYGLDKWSGALTAEDMAADTPYNTSKYPGLPAGPISNPGLDSIRAALYPRDTGYYFYALNPATNFHHFSENYYEHQDYLEEIAQSGTEN